MVHSRTSHYWYSELIVLKQTFKIASIIHVEYERLPIWDLEKRAHFNIKKWQIFSSFIRMVLYKFLSLSYNSVVWNGHRKKWFLNTLGQTFTCANLHSFTSKKCHEWPLLCSEAYADFYTTELIWLHPVAVWIPCSKSFNVKNISTKLSFWVRRRSLKSQKHYLQKNAN